MTAFQYAIARAAYDAWAETKRDRSMLDNPPDFDGMAYERQREWVSVAEAVVDKLQSASRGGF